MHPKKYTPKNALQKMHSKKCNPKKNNKIIKPKR
jgi:hypothetical protein